MGKRWLRTLWSKSSRVYPPSKSLVATTRRRSLATLPPLRRLQTLMASVPNSRPLRYSSSNRMLHMPRVPLSILVVHPRICARILTRAPISTSYRNRQAITPPMPSTSRRCSLTTRTGRHPAGITIISRIRTASSLRCFSNR